MPARRILVIDDEPQIQRLFQNALRKLPCEVDTVSSGLSGAARFAETPYDLVFLDLNIPDVDGVETLQTIRRQNPSVPVYMITGNYDPFAGEINVMNKQGLAFDLLIKPFSIATIRTIVENLSAA